MLRARAHFQEHYEPVGMTLQCLLASTAIHAWGPSDTKHRRLCIGSLWPHVWVACDWQGCMSWDTRL